MVEQELKDTGWIRSNFGHFFSRQYNDSNRYHRSEGWTNYEDTTLGGNHAINAPYQFTRYADIKEMRLAPHVGKGMGRWYSNNINKWGHNVHIRCGVPAYNGVLSYAISAIDGATARMVATGRTPTIFSTMGRVSGWVISAMFWEVTLLAVLINKFIEFTNTRFYYLKPTMFQYWSTVQSMVNTVSANLGLSLGGNIKKDGNFEYKDTGVGDNVEIEKSILDHARNALPDTFRNPAVSINGTQDIGLDVHAIASRAQALQVQQEDHIRKRMETYEFSGKSPTRIAREMEQMMLSGPAYQSNNNKGLKPHMENSTLDAYKKAWSSLKGYSPEVQEDTVGKSIVENNAQPNGGGFGDNIKSWFKETVDSWADTASENPGLHDKVVSEFRDGSAWFTLRVNGAESVGESFSNSTVQSEVGNIFNSLAEKARSFAFNTGGGKTGIGPIDSAIDGIANAAGDFLTSAQSETPILHFLNPVIGLLYGAQIDSPKRWGSSNASLSNMRFKLELRCGYGNNLSYLQDIVVPTCMILCAGLPRGAGPQSFGSPFYVEYYSKGRGQSRVGLITSISIERGVGNKGWTRKGFPLGVDINVEITDMTDVVFSPTVANVSILGKWINPMEENAMGDYLAVMSALGINEQIYLLPRLKRRANKFISEFNSWTSPSRWAALSVETFPGRIINAFSDQMSRR